MEILKKYSAVSKLMLLIIIILGIYIRFSNFSGEGYWNDDMTTIPTALLWFYDHSYYPGLAGQGEPALGNYFIGLGCMLSGQDFSAVTKIQPMFYPGRPALIGKEMAAAERYCHLPMYVFGMLFFIAMIILAMLLLDEYSSIYAIAFFAFSSFTLQLSRWIHVDTLEYLFLAAGLIFLWKFYSSDINARYEKIFLLLSSLSFGFALATKLPAGIFVAFFAYIILKKYKNESLSLLKSILKKLNINASEKMHHEENPSNLIKLISYSILAYGAAILVSFEFKFKNLLLVLEKYSSINPEHSFLAFNRQILLDVYNFLITLNAIDTIILAFSVYISIKLAFGKKEKNEEFIFSLFVLFLLAMIFFPAMNYTRVIYIFIPAIIFVMAFAFADKPYSIFSILKVNNKKAVFLAFILFYIVFSFATALSASPHFTPKNSLLCIFDGPECSFDKLRYFTNPYGLFAKQTASELGKIMQENETFLASTEMIYYYIRQEDSFAMYSFISAARSQLNRRPNLDEFIKYFRPGNRSIRYLVVNPYAVDADLKEFEQFKKEYAPNYIVRAYKIDAAYIYDLTNLKQKK